VAFRIPLTNPNLLGVIEVPVGTSGVFNKQSSALYGRRIVVAAGTSQHKSVSARMLQGVHAEAIQNNNAILLPALFGRWRSSLLKQLSRYGVTSSRSAMAVEQLSHRFVHGARFVSRPTPSSEDLCRSQSVARGTSQVHGRSELIVLSWLADRRHEHAVDGLLQGRGPVSVPHLIGENSEPRPIQKSGDRRFRSFLNRSFKAPRGSRNPRTILPLMNSSISGPRTVVSCDSCGF